MARNTRIDPAHIPSATYRLQFNRLFNFLDAAELVAYLDRLGISDCYASPFLAARPGSMHGYDIIDHTALNPEIGTIGEFRKFSDRLREHGMGLILDVVPNHMCISDPGNRWWWDVLENGPSSDYARFFDIDWKPPKEDLKDKVLLPVLGDQYGKVLENQQIRIEYEDGGFCVAFNQTRLPVAPRTWPLILEPALTEFWTAEGESSLERLELESILTALSYLPSRDETDESRIRERQREKEVIKRRIASLLEGSPEVRNALESSLRSINGTRGDPFSFDRLEALLADQAYRLSYWRVAADEVNYRRFFDINELAAIRVEDPVVFAAVHELVFDLISQGRVTGLRIDHPDGLFEPELYFRDLQNGSIHARLAGGGDSIQPFFVVAEKILVGNEQLRSNWSIEGTTGYRFLNLLNGVFVDRSKRQAFARLYHRFTGWSMPYEDLVYESKMLIMRVAMSSELNVLARELDRISEQHRWSRDFTLESLREALRDVVSCFPVYRTYINSTATRVDPEDERHIRNAIVAAKERNPAINESVFDFIQSVLLLDDPDGLTEEQRSERRIFIMRLQQFTGPVMAKGLEDTAFYRFYPLATLNEVGGNPERFGVSRDTFHEMNARQLEKWPHSLLASATHDNKRGEDLRARLNVLSEIPAEWNRALHSWRRLNRPHKTILAGVEAPGTNVEYLLYQTLVGTWPPEPMEGNSRAEFADRIRQYMLKALREAKRNTSWINPNVLYESAVGRFVDAILDPAPENQFLREFSSFQKVIATAGMCNSLGQVLLKIASPGVPDFYQGTEVWDLSLVDPDNRRPVDFGSRRDLLDRIDAADGENREELVTRLMNDPADGGIKMYVTSRALRHRRSHRDLYSKGTYLPLHAAGLRQNRIIAFARTLGNRSMLAISGRFFVNPGAAARPPLGSNKWDDTAIMLRKGIAAGVFRDVFTGRRITVERRNHRPVLPAAQVFSHLPVALLAAEEDSCDD